MIQERVKFSIKRLSRVLGSWVGLLIAIGFFAPLVSVVMGSTGGFFVSFAVLAILIVHYAGITLQIFGVLNAQKLAAKKKATPAPKKVAPAPKKVTPAPVKAAPAPKSTTAAAEAKKLSPTTLKNTSLPAQLSQTLTVTVVVPMYNEERFISECLDSLLQQSWHYWRCIVVDDASTDESSKIVSKYVAMDSRIEVVRHHRNSGLSASRNTGLRLATTDWITFLDSDDMLLEDSLAMRINYFASLRSDLQLAGVYCGVVQVEEDCKHTHKPIDQNFPRTTRDLTSSQSECPFNAHAPLLKTEILRSVGGFDESMMHGAEDWDLWQRMMRYGFYFRSVPKIGALYRRKKQSMVRSLALEHTFEAKKLYARAQQPFVPQLEFEGLRPFVEPASSYAEAASFARRVIPFAAMTYITAGRSSMEQVLDTMPSSSGSYLARHLNIEQLALVGIKRALAVTDTSAADDDTKIVISTIADSFVDLVKHRDQEAIENQVLPVPTIYKRLVYATDAYEVSLAQPVLADCNGILLIPETVNGTQGAVDRAEQDGLPWISINTFFLKNPKIEEIVVFKTHGFGLDTLRELSTQRDIPIVYQQSDISIEPVAGVLPEISPVGTATKPPASAQTTLNASNNRPVFRYPNSILSLEENPLEAPDTDKLASLKDKHVGERCVIVGNGPSLNSMDLSLLKNEVSFAVNGIFYKTEESGFVPTYFVVEDNSVMEENQAEIRAYDAPHKLFPSIYRKFHPSQENTYFFRLNRGFYEKSSENFCVPRFSTDITQRLYCGQSVTFINLQMAYYMGFSEVYLIGMDFSYTIPASAIRNGDLIVSTEDDPNHFNSQYFGKGKTWKDPKLDRVLQNYYMAKRMYEADGRRIFNATAGGELEAFDRVDFNEVFGAKKSSLVTA